MRDLSKNSKKINRKLLLLPKYAEDEIAKSYAKAMDDIRLTLSRLYEQYNVTGELTRAQRTQFLRLSNIEDEIITLMRPYVKNTEALIKEVAEVGVDVSYLQHGWAIDQAAGVALGWGGLSDTAVRAAAGIGGDLAELKGILSEKEIAKHAKVLDDAFTHYEKDTRKWISRELRDGIIKGEGVPQISKRLKGSLMHSTKSAQLIARTETLRSLGIGSQVAYDEAADKGVNIKQVWDATLDSRTRPAHAAIDGLVQDSDGMFRHPEIPGGAVSGPRRSGEAWFDINCRCAVVGEVEGYAPSVRRIRDEGIQPYQTFKTWAEKNGMSVNKYGQKYNFLT